MSARVQRGLFVGCVLVGVLTSPSAWRAVNCAPPRALLTARGCELRAPLFAGAESVPERDALRTGSTGAESETAVADLALAEAR